MRREAPHTMILASAGSGKTYALVNRYIRLLAHGFAPSRIIALTFTRKAAGEFLENIFMRLLEASSDPSEAARLSSELGLGEASPEFYRNLTGTLVDEIGELGLGTIDSFFGRIVGAFPYELGLTRPHRIMEAFEEDMARGEAMEALMAGGDEEHEEELLQLYKQFTWGAEEKSVFRTFEKSLLASHAVFLEGGISPWGDPAKIFQENPWWSGDLPEKGALIGEIEHLLGEVDLSKSFEKAFGKLIEAFCHWHPGQPVTSWGKLLEELLDAREDLSRGAATLTYNRGKLEIGNPLAGKLLDLLRILFQQEIGRKILVTQSLGRLLRKYDTLYEASIRGAGSLVFADLPALLIKGLCGGKPVFSEKDLLYRLDGQHDHWLLDEFQDTSRIQWKVLSEFVEEVLQDPEGERTFFYVGDVKQSIYGWRGGDSRLFEEIFHRYGKAGGNIRQESLHVSWRSAPPVLECVNTLFGSVAAIERTGREVARRWMENWKDHEASPKTRGLPGYAAWGVVDGEEVTLEEGCIALLQSVSPLERGLSCAILMRDNAGVAAMTQALRSAGIPASMEGVVRLCTDSIIGNWLRAFFLVLARPDERFPAAFLEMAGFSFDTGEKAALLRRTEDALSREGYPEAVRQLLRFLRGKLTFTPFLQRRSEQILEAVTRFAKGASSRPLEAFITFLENASLDESSLAGHVQVMTVHKAKGLDFDMVLVAGFGSATLEGASHRNSLHVQRDAGGEVKWVLDLPRQDIRKKDPVLQAAFQESRDETVFEALCLLYVAMTRARQGLYCISENPTRKSGNVTWHNLLETAFAPFGGKAASGIHEILREWGDPAWFETFTAKEAEIPAALSLDPLPEVEAIPPARFRQAESPSQAAHGIVPLPAGLGSPEGRRFGTRIHAFLATVGWMDFGEAREQEQVLQAAPEDLRERLKAFFATERARKVFSRPAEAVSLWQEKPFVLRKGDRVASGVIDRATLYLGPGGQVEKAVVYDFKTDTLDPGRPAGDQLLEKYAAQLDRYAEAVSILTGLPGSAIAAVLVPV